jgi:hypothetical protein
MSERQVLAIFYEMSEWCLAHGFHAPVEARIDDQWFLAVTGKDAAKLGPADWKIDMKPYSWAVWYNGFIAGCGNPFEGEIAAGEAANESMLSAALKDPDPEHGRRENVG